MMCSIAGSGRRRAPHRAALLALAVACAFAFPAAAPPARSADKDPRAVAKDSIDRGLKWLRTKQAEDGSWSDHPGVTALVLTAYCRSPRAYRETDGPFIRHAVSYLLSLQKEDGSISKGDLAVYTTAVALMALKATGNAQYDAAIQKGRTFLTKEQADEGDGYGKQDKFYGGIGYGNDERPDLSNLQLALQAMAETSNDRSDPMWQKAIVFLQRCQNYSETNDQPWAGNDGGFIYLPDPEHSMVPGGRSYGSMTYAGLKSFLYAGVDKNDPRVQAAVRWLKSHYSVDDNPGMGTQGLFYYYHTMAKALAALGDVSFVDEKGVSHDWYAELVTKLASLQKPDGYWVNDNDRWWERDPSLVTAFAVLALEAGDGDGKKQ
jgi:squalene-hopene/tetraprenyl-beta-curcumene cyclase